MSFQPPSAEVRSARREHHGDTFVDDFGWLRERDDPAVTEYLEAENAWCEAQTGHLAEAVTELVDDVSSRTQETDLSVPQLVRHHVNGETRTYWYYSRTTAETQFPLFSRLPVGLGAPPDPWAGPEGEEMLLDANAEAEQHEFYAMGESKISPDGRLMAWCEDTTGEERFVVRIKDLGTGMRVDEPIENAAPHLAWAGSTHLFYIRDDHARRPFEVWRHRLGTDAEDDQLVYREDDERQWLAIGESRDRRWLLITSGSSIMSEARIVSVGEPEAKFRVICPRKEGLKYRVEVAEDRLLITHNANGPDFELAEAPLEARAADQWHQLIEHQPGVRLLRVDAYQEFLAVSYRAEALTAVKIIPRTDIGSYGPSEDVLFPEPLYHVLVAPGPNYDDTSLRLTYLSLVRPPVVFNYRVPTRSLTVLKEMPVIDHAEHGPYDQEAYVQRRTWAEAEDGTLIPISIVARKDTPTDGTAPGVLYGYGAYEMSIEPAFDPMRISLLDKGFVYAIAHIRGGGELGRPWYLAGKLDQKINSITDFLACAHHLIDQQVVDPDRLAAQGASAAGLVLGGAMNAEPELFRAVHADVAFVDPLTTGLDPDIPLTVTEWEEWGDPLHDKDAYDYIKSYAPYENVRDEQYPAVLATTSLNDSRVSYAEPAKWMAELRRTTKNAEDRSMLLRTEMTGGHGGAPGRLGQWQQDAFALAWLIDQLGGSGRDQPTQEASEDQSAE